MRNGTAAATHSPAHEPSLLLHEARVHLDPAFAERYRLPDEHSDGCESARGMVIGSLAGLVAWAVIALAARAAWSWISS